jgi:hypothetical protein
VLEDEKRQDCFLSRVGGVSLASRGGKLEKTQAFLVSVFLSRGRG